jgi:hypothetical protein
MAGVAAIGTARLPRHRWRTKRAVPRRGTPRDAAHAAQLRVVDDSRCDGTEAVPSQSDRPALPRLPGAFPRGAFFRALLRWRAELGPVCRVQRTRTREESLVECAAQTMSDCGQETGLVYDIAG